MESRQFVSVNRREIATVVGAVVGSSTARKSGGVLPIDDDGDPGVLLRIKAQPVRRPATLAQPHRHVGGIGGFGHCEAGVAAPLGRIDEHSAATMRHQTHHCEQSRQRSAPPAQDKPSSEMGAGAGSEPRATAGYVGRAETFPRPDQLSHLKSQPNGNPVAGKNQPALIRRAYEAA